jgi:hypothetical protein
VGEHRLLLEPDLQHALCLLEWVAAQAVSSEYVSFPFFSLSSVVSFCPSVCFPFVRSLSATVWPGVLGGLLELAVNLPPFTVQTYFDGALSDFRIYGSLLSANQVKALQFLSAQETVSTSVNVYGISGLLAAFPLNDTATANTDRTIFDLMNSTRVAQFYGINSARVPLTCNVRSCTAGYGGMCCIVDLFMSVFSSLSVCCFRRRLSSCRGVPIKPLPKR